MVLVKFITLLLIFLIPIIIPFNFLGYEEAKVSIFYILVSFDGLVWLWLIAQKKIKPQLSLIKVSSIIFLSVLLFTSIFGLDPTASFFGQRPYLQGFLLYFFLFLFSVIVSTINLKLLDVAKCLVVSAVLVSIVAIRDFVLLIFFHQEVSLYAGRVVSTFGQPNFYGGFLLLTLPFSFFLFKNPDKRLFLLGWGSGVISLIGIAVSYSRSAILLALILLILGLKDQLNTKNKWSVVIFAVVLLYIIFGFKLSSTIINSEISRPFSTNNPDLTEQSIEKRVYIWPIAWNLILQQPLTGYGLENIGKAFTDYFRDYKHPLFEENLKVSPVLLSLKELNIDRSHNYLLDLLLFSGILGLLGWLGVVVLLFKKFRQMSHGRGKIVYMVSLLIYLIWIQFQNQSVVHLIYFWLMVGLSDSKAET